MQTIEITATAEGDITLETKGIKGKACKDVSAAIESALGRVTKEIPTAEYFQRVETNNRIGR